MRDENHSRIVILGTGGTIAGAAADRFDNVGYTAAQLSVEQLVDAVPALAAVDLECEQVAQVDSKDMSLKVWQRLAQRVAHHAARPDVAGLVVTHGTDTVEETAFFLQRALAPAKPVVLTAAMRPATALQPDGPQNLLDAVTVAREPGARGVVVVVAGRAHDAADVRKVHSYRIDAFDSGDAGPVAAIEEGQLRQFRAWPGGTPALLRAALDIELQRWPRVEIVLSHAGVGAGLVDALIAHGVRGLVVAGTGNGSVHLELEAALRQAQEAGVQVLRSTRCAFGGVVGDDPKALPSAGALTPVKARIELMLELLKKA
jgi:L-asparaginase